MRPPRIAILVLFITASIFIVCRALTSASRAKPSSYPSEARGTRSLFGFTYYNTPFSLFPPNAAISLTDDNSTSFAARPAAFGPKLAAAGLSGQLWVGSGFAEDSLDGNGELGCSDLPGWGSGNTRAALKNSFRAGTPRLAAEKANSGHSGQLLDPDNRDAIAKARPHSKTVDGQDDNTDNHLNDQTRGAISRRDTSSASSHADIQSIQEAAEIQGKIVLLMRGGCGFLEKVMWAQRRGAVAVIVGDNQKGGPLIQMFAHGDEVDNVTVPSVFTARTTAHLLSSLTQPGSFIEDTLDDNGNPVLKVQQGPKVGQDKRKRTPSPPSTAASRRTAPPTSRAKRAVKDKADKPASSTSGNRGWFSNMFSWGHSPRAVDSESRPPSSGRLDWVLVEDWSDEKDKVLRDSLGKSRKPKSNQDDFVIGVQDWRDPDLVDKPGPGANKGKVADKGIDQKAASSSKDREDASSKSAPEANGPKGGSITPGSGEYAPARVLPKDGKEASAKTRSTASGAGGKGHGLMSKLFGDDENGKGLETKAHSPVDDHVAESVTLPDRHRHEFEPHEGLWVTITPTSSASPFFDTLLVLVISPLVTLTVVYSLLIVRARVRRRRWRAPKSVVDRLPVRTYHTVATSPSLSPRLPSPSSATPTTPLLQHSSSRPRPRSRTTTGVLESETFLVPSPAVPTPQASTRNGGRAEHEKGAGGFSAEWRKYMGRQVECVVCLEEYVDGVSRVMSLPCGHEFHADCITPWLTTRRRTCPICKGDVVRSLAHGSRNGPRYEPYRDDSDEDLDAEASGSRSAETAPDLEQGILSPEPGDSYQSSRQEGWLGLLSNSFGTRTRQQSASPRPEDRSR
ncbi:E3 ubiquitin-protein ligase RNF13 [Tolypocladium capitatum]|uniref:RING-type E3 ubiquitin transferase n=1 Tax=Tolypocladium capitatum TaxID=45235 RepID=A0A2K3Q9X8_9HYPO|nr:E3 ubiquitin-protein ligase RNF13 [Tolypocladium capitatum]